MVAATVATISHTLHPRPPWHRGWYAAGWCGELCARRQLSVSAARQSCEATAAQSLRRSQTEQLGREESRKRTLATERTGPERFFC